MTFFVDTCDAYFLAALANVSRRFNPNAQLWDSSDRSWRLPAFNVCASPFWHVWPQSSDSRSSAALCIFIGTLHYSRCSDGGAQGAPKPSLEDTCLRDACAHRRAQHLRNPPKADWVPPNLLLEISPITDAPLRYRHEERARGYLRSMHKLMTRHASSRLTDSVAGTLADCRSTDEVLEDSLFGRIIKTCSVSNCWRVSSLYSREIKVSLTEENVAWFMIRSSRCIYIKRSHLSQDYWSGLIGELRSLCCHLDEL